MHEIIESCSSCVHMPWTASEAMTQATEEKSSPGSGKNSDCGSPGSGSEDNEAALSPRTPLHEERRLQPICPAILHGEPLTDRKSTFQAHVAMVTTTQEVRTKWSWHFTPPHRNVLISQAIKHGSDVF